MTWSNDPRGKPSPMINPVLGVPLAGPMSVGYGNTPPAVTPNGISSFAGQPLPASQTTYNPVQVDITRRPSNSTFQAVDVYTSTYDFGKRTIEPGSGIRHYEQAYENWLRPKK